MEWENNASYCYCWFAGGIIIQHLAGAVYPTVMGQKS